LPTPIQHLVVAEYILTAPDLPPAVRARLDADDEVRGAFLFGHIAPDVQVVSRQPRESTHFYTIPPTNRRPAYRLMLSAYPELANPAHLSPAQAAFVAGYISHLLLDEAWTREIFCPVFGPGQTWADWRERLLLHNVLRTWLDRRDLPRVPVGAGDLLRRAQPDSWLPFAADADLRRWRDIVADQFTPGAAIRTVEIFARRARIPDAEFLTLLDAPVMEQRVFTHTPLAELEAYDRRAIARTTDLTLRYLNGCALDESV